MSVNISSVAQFGTELAASMTGSWVKIGTITVNPVHLIFDNQGTVAVAISVDGGTTTWRTFPAGEAIMLDMRANHGLAPNFTTSAGITFFGNGASGTFVLRIYPTVFQFIHPFVNGMISLITDRRLQMI